MTMQVLINVFSFISPFYSFRLVLESRLLPFIYFILFVLAFILLLSFSFLLIEIIVICLVLEEQRIHCGLVLRIMLGRLS